MNKSVNFFRFFLPSSDFLYNSKCVRCASYGDSAGIRFCIRPLWLTPACMAGSSGGLMRCCPPLLERDSSQIRECKPVNGGDSL